MTTHLDGSFRKLEHIVKTVNVCQHVSVKPATVLLLNPLVVFEHALHVLEQLLDLFPIVLGSELAVSGLHAPLALQEYVEGNCND